MLYRLDDHQPRIDATCFIAPNATLIGQVHVDAEASIWFGTVLRGDTEALHIGRGSNVQDNSVLHADPGFPLILEEDVTIGHLAIVHGCFVGAGSLIGMGATVMNGAKIGAQCLIGAGSLITEGKEIPPRSIVRGAPGKVVGEVSEQHLANIARTAKTYRERAQRYRLHLQPVG
ncbi:gamma carbonic anhydrase family protein [Beijerinckia indica]|uniref:Transferase hexapeptide repeat containing protein n=1 Tax=Beijerinckia indica subsp. indica (strain ATCC 9039 / DSM 1715 / NCIMB 8712) TaxID=395963 RepID=B2IFX8_BEII9|nr:gamma carbonic anhydrase family protein [Beijerinckia indica]ACB95717.1 conserved hypothetical protein [Beijerinckia indica subsp. indica ATCC 9039]